MKTSDALGIFRIGATYTGTVIGAGFASGQEIMQFFAAYGSHGLIGVIFAGTLFSWLGSYILCQGYRLQATGYHQLLYRTCGPFIGTLLDALTVFFLFGSLSIMLSGMSSVMNTYFGLNFYIAHIINSLLICLIVITGIKGIGTANMIIIPGLFTSTVIVSYMSFLHHGFNSQLLSIPVSAHTAAPHWMLSSLLYVSYNLIIAATVLGPLGAYTQNRRVRLLGGLLGGVLLTFFAGLVTFIILIHYPGIKDYDIPMLYVASHQTSWSFSAYALTLLGAMLTTAISALYGCAAKLKSILKIKFNVSVFILLLTGLYTSTLGFTRLISTLYPLFGYLALIFTLTLIYQALRDNQ